MDKRAWRDMLMKAFHDLPMSATTLAAILDIREGVIHSWLNMKNLPNQKSRDMIAELIQTIYVARAIGVVQE